MRRPALFLLAVAVAGFAPAPFPKEHRRDDPAPSMEGQWYGTRWLLVRESHASFDFHNVWGPSYRLRVDPRRRPAAFELCPTNSGEPQFLGIYRVRGGTLTLSYSPAAKGRPTSFDGSGKGEVTEVYRRIKH